MYTVNEKKELGGTLMKNTTFEKDLFRYYGEDGENLKKRLLRPAELKYIYIDKFNQPRMFCLKIIIS